MNETIYLKKLEQREIKPTAIRLLILKTMMQPVLQLNMEIFAKQFFLQWDIFALFKV